MEAEEYFLHENNDLEGLQNYVRILKTYEREMQAVQCCSKSVYEVLKLTKNRELALALK
jgi:protein involved in ribonucleotide reduction